MRLRLLTALAFVLVLALPGLARASGTAVIKDCTYDGVINGHYSTKDYADALANLPADVDEYSDCRDQIKRAQLGAGGSSGGTGGGGTSGAGGAGGGGTTGGGAAGNGDTGTGSGPVDPLATATPAEVASFQKAVQAGNAPVALDGRPITPGTLGGAKTSGLSQLPTPLLVMLALLAAGGIGAAGFGTKRLVHGRRTA
ncbi:MAG: hypothetical protein QOH30_1433 [Baekduia sp.]|jgi:hypothetical protein|nr:hypothetical protein [Baekduia sp.]MDX6731221.1 hypothetical protein [Baekduia sp.]